MNSEKEKSASWKWVFVAVVVVLFILLWHRNSVLNGQVEKLRNEQTIIIQNQIRLQAATQLLTSNQITALAHDASWGNISAMENLYTYYKGLNPSTNENGLDAFMWGTLTFTYLKDAEAIKQINKHYEKILSHKKFKLAKTKIAHKKQEIDANIESLVKSVTNTVNAINAAAKNPIGAVENQAKQLILKSFNGISNRISYKYQEGCVPKDKKAKQTTIDSK